MSDARVEHGNAGADRNARHWVLGDFVDSASMRSTEDVEVKWHDLKQGEARAEWAHAEARPTITILVRGKVSLRFPNETVTLEREGDYAMWENVGHTYEAHEDSLAVTVRWPSARKD